MTHPVSALPERAARFITAGPRPCLVAGQSRSPASAGVFTTYNPATGEAICEVARAGPAEVDEAVAAARASLTGAWSSVRPADRTPLLLAVADKIREHAHDLAHLETLDCGMPLADAYAAVHRAVDHFRYFAGWATKVYGETIPVSTEDTWLNYTKPLPVGVVAGIIAWNTPLDNATWKLGAPLAVGCPVVLKPAEQTPLAALYLGSLIVEVGLPEGALSVLTGFGDVGAALAAHPGVDKVAFTGSTEVGQAIVRASAGNLKRVSLELGGKSPAIVFDDADVEATAAGVANGIFHNAGQICCASSRLIAHRKVVDDLVEAVTARAKTLQLGSGFDPATEMGPLISPDQLARVLGYVEASRADGARLVFGGHRAGGALAEGWFVQPTVFDGVDDAMAIAREEVFGPVLAVSAFERVDELRSLANASKYGLAASVWTRDISRALWTVDQIDAGIVWVNGHTVLDLASPFGGTKHSGHGRELGRDVVEGYLERKSVWLRYDEPLVQQA